MIGDKIAITVVRIAPGIVRIGVDAPEEFPILREELVATGKVPAAAAELSAVPAAASHAKS